MSKAALSMVFHFLHKSVLCEFNCELTYFIRDSGWFHNKLFSPIDGTLGCPTIGSLFAPQANKYDILIRNWMQNAAMRSFKLNFHFKKRSKKFQQALVKISFLTFFEEQYQNFSGNYQFHISKELKRYTLIQLNMPYYLEFKITPFN